MLFIAYFPLNRNTKIRMIKVVNEQILSFAYEHLWLTWTYYTLHMYKNIILFYKRSFYVLDQISF